MVSGRGANARASAVLLGAVTIASAVLAPWLSACAEFTTFDGLVGPAPVDEDGGTSLETTGDGGKSPARDGGAAGTSDGGGPTTGGDGGASGEDGATPPPPPPSGGITFIGAKDKDGITNSDSVVNVTSPATAAGQLLIAAAFTEGPSNVNVPTGFTAIPNGAASISAEFDLATFFKITTAADIGASFAFSAPDSEGVTVIVGAYAGTSTTAPINKDVSSQNTSATAPPSVSGAWVVGVLGSATVGGACTWNVTSPGIDREGADAIMLGDSNGPSTTGTFGGSCNMSGFPGGELTLAIAIAPQ